MSARRAFALAAIALCVTAPPAAADHHRCDLDPPLPASSRLVRAKVGGWPVTVLLPPQYASSGRRYGVLFLLHPGLATDRSWVSYTDLLAFTAAQPDASQAIVVMPDSGPVGWYADWNDGSQRWMTLHLRVVLPWVDRTFRTLADRAHRAVAGFSMGGYGALHYAAQRPDLFVAAGSFSGNADIASPAPFVELTGPGFWAVQTLCGASGGGIDPTALFGDPVTREWAWHDNSPLDLVPNFRGQRIYLAVGTGDPCDQRDLTDLQFGNERAVRDGIVALDAALKREDVDVSADFDKCGVHSFRYAERDLHRFWPLMLGAFGREAPTRVSHRRAAGAFTAYGWRVTPDPRRAPEFLDLRDADASGATLTGSGLTHVLTAPLFGPGTVIDVRGAGVAQAVTAGPDGRASFVVDLGPPATTAQYTALRRDAFTTRRISLSAGRAARR